MTRAVVDYKVDAVRTKIIPNLFSTILLVIISVVPLLDRDLPQVIRLGVFFIWLITALSIGSFQKKSLERDVIVGWTLYLCLQFVYSIIGASRELTYFLARCYIYAIPVAMVYIIRYYNRKELKVLLYSILIVFVICLIHNFFLGSSGDEEIFDVTSEAKGTNAGGTPFVSGCLFILPSLWLLCRYTKSKILKLFSIFVIVSCMYYMLVINSRTTILVVLGMLVVGLFIVEVPRKKEISSRSMVIRLVLIIMLLTMVSAPILSTIAGYYEDFARMSDRLEDLSYVASGGKVLDIGHGSLFYRYLLWQTSINTFFDSLPNFLFGIGEKEVVGDLDSLIASGVGGHSEYFDLAARYGLLGITIYIGMLRKTFHYVLNLITNSKIKNCVVVFLLCVVVYSFFNNFTNQACAMIMLFLFFPIMLKLLNENNI